MAKDKTLNKDDREKLFAFAKANITCPVEQKAMDDAYKVAKPFVLDTVHSRFPLKDMKVLDRYGAARRDECIRFGGLYDNDSVFRFRSGDTDIPLVPRQNSCRELDYEWSKEARDALNAYVLARQAHNKAMERKTEDYRKLIVGSRMFNDVVAVWPAAEAIRDRLMPKNVEQRALAVLSEDAIARIRADNAGAAA